MSGRALRKGDLARYVHNRKNPGKVYRVGDVVTVNGITGAWLWAADDRHPDGSKRGRWCTPVHDLERIT